MHEAAVKSSWDSLLFGIPLLVLLFVGFFRLDEVFTSHKKHPSRSRKPIRLSTDAGEPVLRDPDGRPSD